ncbi:transposase domain-containing protein [Streptomyces sp. DT203]|uniref:transposase domain-containing protein n=1 Tax=Streptomyces sp. DT203 TaxID=3393424 RepID=UPI003CF63A71
MALRAATAAMCLFPEVGYRLVWQKLTAGLASLAGLDVAWPTAKALRGLRRRIGTWPLHRFFELLSGPLAQPTRQGCGSDRSGRSHSTAAARSKSRRNRIREL